MDQPGSMELVHKPVQDVLALVPESVTRDFRLPGGEHQRSEGKLSVVRELYAECPRCHEPSRRILSVLPFLVRLC
jgi:hypothetical protein